MIRRLERLRTPQLLGVLSAVSAASLAADLLSPWLIARVPMALAVLSPRSMYVVAITHRVPEVLLVPLVTMRLCLTDPIHFELGRRIPVGPKGHRLAGRIGARVRRVVDAVPAFGFLIAVAAWPVSHTLVAAGAGRAPRRRIAIVDIAGTLVRVAVVCFVLGRIDSVVAAARVASHVGPLAVVSVLTYAAVALAMRRRERSAADGWDDIANQVEALRLEERVREAYGLAWPLTRPEGEQALRPWVSSGAAGA